MRLGILTSHPIQYQAPWFRELARRVELEVFFAYRPTHEEQGEGFGKAFAWDVDLLSGYQHCFLKNVAKHPGATRFGGCDTPEIGFRIRQGEFDAFIVNGWYLKCYWQAVNACRRGGIPVLVRGDSQLMTPRSRLKQVLKEIAYRQMLKRFDGFLTVGQRNEGYLRHYGVPEEKLFPAPHFVDNMWFAKKADESRLRAAALRREWGAGSADFVAVFVGKLIPKKRPGDLLAAAARLDLSARCRVVFIGSGELEEMLRKEGEARGVFPMFAGFKNQSELPACYSAADAIVLPSDGGETWGLVINEAMACGTPAIVSNACGCEPNLIDHGVTGFSFPLGNVATLSDCLTQMASRKQSGYDWSQALAHKIGQYSIDACTSGTVSAVSAVLARRI